MYAVDEDDLDDIDNDHKHSKSREVYEQPTNMLARTVIYAVSGCSHWLTSAVASRADDPRPVALCVTRSGRHDALCVRT